MSKVIHISPPGHAITNVKVIPTSPLGCDHAKTTCLGHTYRPKAVIITNVKVIHTSSLLALLSLHSSAGKWSTLLAIFLYIHTFMLFLFIYLFFGVDEYAVCLKEF